MQNQRLISLDLFRGMTVALMILVNNGFGTSFAMLQHSKWNGLTPCDLVFPFFLFIMGISTYLSLKKSDFRWSKPLARKLVKRGALLILIGLAINWFDLAISGRPFDLAHLRYWGVMQRIGICYLVVAATALTLRRRFMLPLAMLLLAAYGVVLVCGDGYVYDARQNILAQADLRLFGYDHLYHKSPVDPEGLISTLSAIAHTMIGFEFGRILCLRGDVERKVRHFLVSGGLLVVSGFCLSVLLPLNKRVWSPSYALVTCGLAALFLGLMIWLVDGRRQAREKEKTAQWMTFLLIFGVNPLFLYIVSEALSILFGHFGINAWVCSGLYVFIPWPQWMSLAYALLFVVLHAGIGYPLYRRRIFIKL